jgi:4'-phosphopantetheinyl transferase
MSSARQRAMGTSEALVAPSPCRAWKLALDHMPSAADIAWLAPGERAVAARFVFERDRRRYLAAHVALRKTLATYLGERPENLRFESGGFGKPLLVHAQPCAFNLSRSGDVAIIAVAPEGQIGVDVELVRAMPSALTLAMHNFCASERESLQALAGLERDTAFLRCWTRKEACLKAVGSGLSIAPRLFETGICSTRRNVVVPTDAGPVEMVVESLPEDAGMVVAVARINGRAR